MIAGESSGTVLRPGLLGGEAVRQPGLHRHAAWCCWMPRSWGTSAPGPLCRGDPRYPEHPSRSERAREGAGNEAGHSCPIPGVTPRLLSPIWGLLCSFLTAQRGLIPAFACVLVRKRPLYALFGREGGEPVGSRAGGMAHPSVGVEYGCRLEVRSVVRTVT